MGLLLDQNWFTIAYKVLPGTTKVRVAVHLLVWIWPGIGK